MNLLITGDLVISSVCLIVSFEFEYSIATDGVISVSTTSDSIALLSSSCMYIDGNGSTHEINQEDMAGSKADPLGESSLNCF